MANSTRLGTLELHADGPSLTALRRFPGDQPHLRGRPHVLDRRSACLLLRDRCHGSLGGTHPDHRRGPTYQALRPVPGSRGHRVHCTYSCPPGKWPSTDVPTADGSLGVPWLDLRPQGRLNPHEHLRLRFHNNAGRLGWIVRLYHFSPDVHGLTLLCRYFHRELPL